MSKTTTSRTLCQLKKRYEQQYVEPLRHKFTRPPEMFNDHQIRIKKQIEWELINLDSAEICPMCNGACVIVKLVPEYDHKAKSWKEDVDPRAYVNNQCWRCCGEGIVVE